MKITIITGTTQGLGSEILVSLQPKTDKIITINRRSTDNSDEILCDFASKEAVEQAKSELGSLLPEKAEILFVLNAGDYGTDETVSDTEPDAIGKIMYTNVFGQLTLVEYLIKSGYKVKLVAISSRMASISESDEPYHYAYSASKASLNLSVRLLKQQYDRNLDYLLVDPGWMRTQMGGDEAPTDPSDTAAFVVSAIDDPDKWNNSDGMMRVGNALTAW